MFLVENFLCCFELETGGLFFGWLGLVCDTISVLLLVALNFFVAKAKCEDIQQAFETIGQEISSEQCDVIKTGTIVISVVSILFLLGLIVIDYLLIKGVRRRNHTLIRPFVIATAIAGILLTAGNILTFSLRGLITAIVYTLMYGYIYACLYSLYVKIRDEKRGSAQYMHP